MVRLPVISALAIGVLLCSPARPGAQAPTQAFKSRVDLVSFGVTALDRKGKFVTDLRESDFEVYEDGARQTLKYFVPGSAEASARGPLHLAVLLDISGSMQEDITLSRTAAIKFLRTLDMAEDMTLVDFDTEVRMARYSPDDFPSLVERIRSRRADGYTALYDAIGAYLHSAQAIDGRKILILYTDGGDNDSSITFGDALTLLRASDVTVYTIALVEHAGSAAMELRSRLRRVAEVTGGEAYAPTALKDLDGVYEKLRDEIKAQYALGYASTNLKQDGEWRKVEIKVKRDGVKLRTRKGYYAPTRAGAR